ncbi:hypothetical protein QFZ27_004477 [Inquilinus ginsengisoli]|uniref:hypothetical protein n=1 Tax=Inquilinus ginsengisoli TaxID=363840 RepID=UPI003D1995A2
MAKASLMARLEALEAQQATPRRAFVLVASDDVADERAYARARIEPTESDCVIRIRRYLDADYVRLSGVYPMDAKGRWLNPVHLEEHPT